MPNVFYQRLFGLLSGQDIVEDFEKWRTGGLIEQLKAAVEEVGKEGWQLRMISFELLWPAKKASRTTLSILSDHCWYQS